jgi:polar amino acid transport system permease protein
MNFDRVLTWHNIERLLVGNLFIDGSMGGLLLTLAVGVLAIVASTVLGTIIGLMRNAESKLLRLPALIYIQVLWSIPVLVLIFWVYFIPPQLFGFSVSPFLTAVCALTLFTAAYIAEIVRGGIQAVPQGQRDATLALGMTHAQMLLSVVLPQAFHAMLPVLASRYVVVIKNTSLAFLIGLADLTEIGKEINGRLMTSPIQVYITILAVYFCVNRLISFGMSRLEDRDRFNRWFTRF